MRKAERGGIGPGEQQNETEGTDVEDRKGQEKKVNAGEKRECWQKYVEEQSWDDVWKLVKLAKELKKQ